MANLKDLIVSGPIKAISGVEGDLHGTAEKATKDASGNTITSTYATKTEVNNSNKNTMRSTEFIVGTQTGTTGTWTGVTEDSSLYDGKNINYFLPQAGSGNATLTLTFSGGTNSGAKPVYLWGTTYVTTQYPANSCINMTYNATKGAWFVNADRDANNDTYDRVKNPNTIKASAACTNGKIICGTSSGYRDVASGVTFQVDYPLLYCGTAIASGNTGTNNYLKMSGVNLQTTKASWTGTQWAMVYLIGTLSGKTVTIDSNVFTTTVPTSADNKVYMPIGILYSTYQLYFNPEQTLYQYRNGSFQQISFKLAKGSATQPIYFDSNGEPQNTTYTLGKSVPSDAVFTDNDTKNTAGGDDTSSKIFLVGMTAQTTSNGTSRTYSHDTAFVDTSGQLNSANPAAGTNSTVVATTKWVTDKGYLTSHQTIKNQGTTGATINTFAACSTAAATAAKTASITTGTFNLETGSRVFVKFANKNTADSPTLNINSKGDKNIFSNGSQITTGGNKELLKGICEFVYDGTQWHLVGNYIDTNTDTLMTQNVSSTSSLYPLLMCPTADATANQGAKTGIFGAGNSLNPYTGGLQLRPNRTDLADGCRIDFKPANTDAGNQQAGIRMILGSGLLNIQGLASADGTTVTGQGTALVINPYAKTITGGYTITGNLTGTATKATQDGSGNVITSTYVNLTGAQTISGAKTFSNTVTISNASAINMTASEPSIKKNGTSVFRVNSNGCTIISTAVSSGQELVFRPQGDGVTNTQMNIKADGSLALNNNSVTMHYNSTTEAIEFVFA